MTTLAVLSVLIWLYLLLAHGRFWRSEPELPPARSSATTPVTIVIPARDEAPSIAQALQSLLAQDYSGSFRVVLVDDGSSDGTGGIARSIGDPRLTVLSGEPRPAGWSGKLWAVAQGLDQADSELVLLTDADIIHDPRHLRTLVAHAERGNLDMVSEMVALACNSPAEHALVPAFVFFFQLLYPFANVNDPLSGAAAAAGGTILIRHRALERIGGIQAIRGALIDDVALAVAVKRGGRIWLGHTRLAHSIREYPRAGDIWRMVARTAYVQLRFSPLLLIGTTLGMALTFLLPPSAALFVPGMARWCGWIAWGVMAACYQPTLHRYGRAVLWAPALPLVAAFYMAATIGSAVNHHVGRGVAWKGRAYA